MNELIRKARLAAQQLSELRSYLSSYAPSHIKYHEAEDFDELLHLLRDSREQLNPAIERAEAAIYKELSEREMK